MGLWMATELDYVWAYNYNAFWNEIYVYRVLRR